MKVVHYDKPGPPEVLKIIERDQLDVNARRVGERLISGIENDISARQIQNFYTTDYPFSKFVVEANDILTSNDNETSDFSTSVQSTDIDATSTTLIDTDTNTEINLDESIVSGGVRGDDIPLDYNIINLLRKI